MMKMLKTLLAFLLFVVFIPFIVFLHFTVRFFRWLTCKLILRENPHVSIVTSPSLRAHMDTARKPGIITLVLWMNGMADIEKIRQGIKTSILEKQSQPGKLDYPNLRRLLRTSWSMYVWETPEKFSLNDHVVLVTSVYRGRPVTHANIQDYVSDVCSKPLPPGHPPWQITIIPLHGAPPSFYVLIRLHHLVAEGLALRDILTSAFPEPWLGEATQRHALTTPVASQQLVHRCQELISHKWRDMLTQYDPRVNVDAVTDMSATRLVVCLIASGLAALQGLAKVYQSTRMSNILTTLLYVSIEIPRLMAEEIRNYGITPIVFCQIILHIITVGLFTTLFQFLGSVVSVIRALLKPKIVIPDEPSTPKLKPQGLVGVWTLFKETIVETYWILRTTLTTPRILLEEFMRPLQPSPFHNVSYSGRKVVTWSDPIPLDLVKKIKNATNTTVNEVLLAACTGALRDYFKLIGTEMPEDLLCTLPVYNQRFTSAQADAANGIIPLGLPVSMNDNMEILGTIKNRLELAKHKPVKYLATVWLLTHISSILPSFIIPIIFNYVTRRYPLMLTNVITPSLEPHMKTVSDQTPLTVWGYPIQGMLYWRPPQSNVGMSLSLVTYGDSIRLAVMTDRQVSPQYAVITNYFLRELWDFAATVGVSRERLSPHSSPVTTPRGSPPPSPGIKRRFQFPLLDGD